MPGSSFPLKQILPGMPTFLICPPRFYGIEYEINPWMCREKGSIPHRAWWQWDNLCKTIWRLGGTTERLVPVSGLPDMAFTANAGLVVNNQFIISRFRHKVRQGESPYHAEWFKNRGYTIITPPSSLCFEGEGDALWVGETLFIGYPIRTDKEIAPWLAQQLQKEVVPLELVDPRFYHLDTCFCPLDENRVLYYPPAFSEAGQRLLKERIPHLIPMEQEDACHFGANAIVMQNHLILNTVSEGLTKRLRDFGFDPHPLDLSEFIKAGGSAKCLVLHIAT